MSVFDFYKKQIATHGNTLRDRNVNRLQHTIMLNAPGNPAYKALTINGVDMHAVINSKDDYNVKEIVCMPGDKAPLGSEVVFNNKTWLITGADVDDEIYAKSKMQLCNCIMRWKDKYGDVHTYNGVAEDATKYSEGVESTQYLRVAEFQIKVKLHLDSNTAIIGRDMRFVIDAEKYIDDIIEDNSRPFVFRATRRNIVTGTFTEDGYVEITLVQDQWIEGKDDYDEMLASQPYELAEGYPIESPKDDPSSDIKEGSWL